MGYSEWEFSHLGIGWNPTVSTIASTVTTPNGNILFLSEYVNTDLDIDQMQLREFSLYGDTLAVINLGVDTDYRRTPSMLIAEDANYVSWIIR